MGKRQGFSRGRISDRRWDCCWERFAHAFSRSLVVICSIAHVPTQSIWNCHMCLFRPRCTVGRQQAKNSSWISHMIFERNKFHQQGTKPICLFAFYRDNAVVAVAPSETTEPSDSIQRRGVMELRSNGRRALLRLRLYDRLDRCKDPDSSRVHTGQTSRQRDGDARHL